MCLHSSVRLPNPVVSSEILKMKPVHTTLIQALLGLQRPGLRSGLGCRDFHRLALLSVLPQSLAVAP